jgi:antitoxin component YwqK of YwqJK toxin-antitoxin module
MQNNNIIGYKKARNNILVTLQIPYDAKHNIDRKNIINKQYAKYRCSHATVTDIIDLNNNTSIDKAISLNDSNFIYTIGQDVVCDTFEPDLEIVCCEGIHFFLDKHRATFYENNLDNFQGEYKEWNDNGLLIRQFFILNGMKHGEYKLWNYDGILAVHTYYNYDMIHSEYKEWYDDGQLYIHTTYKEGMRNGEYREWFDNGQLKIHTYYKDDRIHGEYKEWHNNGQLKIHTYYIDNKIHGEYKSWNNNSQLAIQCTYNYGGIYDEYKQWNR